MIKFKRLKRILVVCSLFSATPFVYANTSAHLIHPTPKWVQQFHYSQPRHIPYGQISNGTYYLLLATQVKLSNQGSQVNYTVAKKIINNTGLDHNAIVHINYDASLESLAINSVTVLRNGTMINELINNPVRIVQRESSLNDNLYDKIKTATIILNDLKVGDIIVYNYTILKKSLWHKDTFYKKFMLNYGVPIHQVYATITTDRHHKLYIKNINSNIKPIIINSDNNIKYVWQVKNPQPITIERNVPIWYNPYARVQVSTTNNWADVVKLLMPYFTVPTQLAPALKPEIDKIKKHSTNKRERVAAALTFVQHNIHYARVEIGIGNIKPNPPAQIYQQKYGDCKDKAFLMVTMLHYLGIDAHVALVNVMQKQALKNSLASIDAFDHAIVTVKVNGTRHWLDPTRDYQATSLHNIYMKNYGYALVLKPGTDKLTQMIIPSTSQAVITINETYNLRHGFHHPIQYDRTEVFHGREAELMRYVFASSAKNDITKSGAHFIENYYDGVAPNMPTEISDDPKENTTTLKQHYLIANFWKKDDDGMIAKIKQFTLNEFLQSAALSPRRMPIHLLYPLTVEAKVTILLPKVWHVTKRVYNISNLAFDFHKTINYHDKAIIIHYFYKNKMPFVPVKYAKKYATDINTIQDNHLINTLTFNDS